MKDRPPDHHNHITLTHTNTPTDGNPKIQTTFEPILVASFNQTVENVASEKPTQAIDNSGKNHQKIIRTISSTPQQTPPLQISDNSNNPIANNDSLKKHEEQTAGELIPTSQVYQVQHQPNAKHNVNHFPKISTNFDRSIPTIADLKQKIKDSTAQPVRQNAPMIFNASNNHNGVSSAAPPPPNVIPTFATKLRAVQANPQAEIQLQPVKRTTKQGLPAVIFNRQDYMVKLAERCKYTVVGKFSSNMPKMDIIRRSLTSQLQINGTIKVTHFNSRHVYIDLDNELDHSTVWHKGKMFVEGMCMRLFVWTPTFKPQEETPIAPVWVILPELPWHCYCMEVVSPLLEDLGKALFLDAATFKRTRGSVAKVKLELDLTKERPNHIWMGYDEDEFGDGRWQEVQYENVPSYCSHCMHQGHAIHACTVKAREDLFQKHNDEEMQKTTFAPSTSGPKQLVTDRERDLMLQDKRGQEEPQATVKDRKSKRGKPSNLQYVPKNPTTVEKHPGIGNDSAILREPLHNPVKSVELLCSNPFEILSNQGSPECVKPPALNSGVNSENLQGGVVASQVPLKNSDVAGSEVPVARIYPPTNSSVATVRDAYNLESAHKEQQLQAKSTVENVADACAFPEPDRLPTNATIATCSGNVPLIVTDSAQGGEPCQSHIATTLDLCADKNKSKSTLAQGGNVPDSLPTGDVLKSDVACYRDVTLLFDSATTSTYKENNAMIKNPVVVPQKIADKNTSESTKDWILKSFYGSKQDADKSELLVAIEQHTGFFENAEQHRMMLSNNGQNAEKVQEKLTADMTQNATDLPCDVAPDIEFPNHPGKEKNAEVQHTPASNGKARGQKKKKKTDKNTVKPEELTEEDIRKAKIRAWQDVILAKSYAQFPPAGELVGGSMENKIAYSVPSQSNNLEQTETEAEKSVNDHSFKKETEQHELAVYVSPAQSGSTLTPTSKLEVICKRASKLMRETGRGFFPVTPREQSVNEGFEPETIFLGDLFDDSGKDQSIPSKIGKSKWNLNAPLFIPNALRQQESQVATDNVDSQKVPTLEFPNAPSDEVLLKNLDLHDIRGLLLRQNSPPQELPQKFSSAHPGIIEDGSEYEDEDEESTAYNYMEESRHAGLSPRLDQVRKPKLIKKKRRPLELKKKEEAPKEPKRVQPTRSSKSKSARANYAAKRL